MTTLTEKKTLAALMQEDAEKLSRVAKEEIAMLKKIQHLLDSLAKGGASSANQQCLTSRNGNIQVRIETTGSSLPKHYTISVKGKKILYF